MHHQHDSPIDYTEILTVGSCRDKRKVLMIMPTPIVKNRWWITENRINQKIKRLSNRNMREMTWNVVKDADPWLKNAKGKARIGDGVITFSSGAWLLIKLMRPIRLASILPGRTLAGRSCGSQHRCLSRAKYPVSSKQSIIMFKPQKPYPALVK